MKSAKGTLQSRCFVCPIWEKYGGATWRSWKKTCSQSIPLNPYAEETPFCLLSSFSWGAWVWCSFVVLLASVSAFLFFFSPCPGMLASPLTFQTPTSCQAKLQAKNLGWSTYDLVLATSLLWICFFRSAYFPPDILALDIFICSITPCEICRVMSPCLRAGSCHIRRRFIICFTFSWESCHRLVRALLEGQNHVHFGSWWLTVTCCMFCDRTFY